MTTRLTPIVIQAPRGMFVFRPLAYALGKVATRIDKGVVARLYEAMSVEQRAQFWEALDTSVPDEWYKAHRDLRRPLTTPSEPTTQTIGDGAGDAASYRLGKPMAMEWARPGGGS